ncbi:hypothetical protein [Celeribacter sp.]|uniref:hypothetical protein n=1 Tax=Celeribacter sp. TaxID=1890673 RepID=UPI003A8EF6D2
MMIATHKGTQQDLAGQLEHLAAELGDLRASLNGRDAYMMAKGVRQAIEVARGRWFCRVADLEEWAARREAVATAPPEPVEPTIEQKRTQLRAELSDLQTACATREITPALASMITGRIMREDAALARCEQAARIAS